MTVSIEKVMTPAYRQADTLGPMSLGKQIKRWREERGMSQDDLALRVGVTQPTIAALESGKSRGTKHISKFARALGVSVDALESEESSKSNLSTGKRGQNGSVSKKSAPDFSLSAKPLSSIRVTGAVQAGAWREALEWDPADQYELPVALPEQYRNIPVFGFEVHGPSMEKVYKHGTVIMAVRYIDLGREPGERERVVAQRFKAHLVEASVKTFRRDASGVAHLWPESNHPAFQTPLDLDPGEGEEVQVTHKVIGSISFEP
jgi:transcriptional regulator with XRE-family HTH domain